MNVEIISIMQDTTELFEAMKQIEISKIMYRLCKTTVDQGSESVLEQAGEAIVEGTDMSVSEAIERIKEIAGLPSYMAITANHKRIYVCSITADDAMTPLDLPDDTTMALAADLIEEATIHGTIAHGTMDEINAGEGTIPPNTTKH